jgi:N-methylhydantoinase A
VAFGGAGPLHGAEVADILEIPEVIVPPYPGITSAMGLLTTDLKYDAIRTQFQLSSEIDIARLNADFAAMEKHLIAQFASDHLDTSKLSFVRDGDLRYVGQGYELKTPIPSGTLDPAAMEKVWADFHALHKREYGHFFQDSVIEVVNIRLIGVGAMPKIKTLTAPSHGSMDKARIRSGECAFRVDGELKTFETVYYRRHHLPVGVKIPGPAVFLQKDSTTVLPPRWNAVQDKIGNLILTREGHKK